MPLPHTIDSCPWRGASLSKKGQWGVKIAIHVALSLQRPAAALSNGVCFDHEPDLMGADRSFSAS